MINGNRTNKNLKISKHYQKMDIHSFNMFNQIAVIKLTFDKIDHSPNN